MSKCIGGITHEVASSLATHKPSKSFGNLFEENKAQLESLQAGLARAVLPKTPPIPTVKYSDFGIISIPEFGRSNSPFSFDDFNIRRGPLGKKLYAAMPIMRFAANPPTLLCACVLSERCTSIRLLSSRSMPFSSVEFYHVDASTRSSCSCVCE